MKVVKSFVQLLTISVTLVSGTPNWYDASDGRHYLIEQELKYNWYEAFHECERTNAQLVIIDTETKNDALVELLGNVVGSPKDLWLGSNDQYADGAERPFYWSSTGQIVSFTYWDVGQPDNYENTEHCMHTHRSSKRFQWNDTDCTKKYGFICERKLCKSI